MSRFMINCEDFILNYLNVQNPVVILKIFQKHSNLIHLECQKNVFSSKIASISPIWLPWKLIFI